MSDATQATAATTRTRVDTTPVDTTRVDTTRVDTAPVVALRAATGDDLPRILALLADARLPHDGVAELVARRAADMVVVDDPGAPGALVATGALEIAGRDALVRSVAVAAPWRGRGVGDAIVRRLLRDAADHALDACWLLTTTAAPFFARRGFAITTRDAVPAALAATVEFTSACPASATVMVRPVAAPARGDA